MLAFCLLRFLPGCNVFQQCSPRNCYTFQAKREREGDKHRFGGIYNFSLIWTSVSQRQENLWELSVKNTAEFSLQRKSLGFGLIQKKRDLYSFDAQHFIYILKSKCYEDYFKLYLKIIHQYKYRAAVQSNWTQQLDNHMKDFFPFYFY